MPIIPRFDLTQHVSVAGVTADYCNVCRELRPASLLDFRGVIVETTQTLAQCRSCGWLWHADAGQAAHAVPEHKAVDLELDDLVRRTGRSQSEQDWNPGDDRRADIEDLFADFGFATQVLARYASVLSRPAARLRWAFGVLLTIQVVGFIWVVRHYAGYASAVPLCFILCFVAPSLVAFAVPYYVLTRCAWRRYAVARLVPLLAAGLERLSATRPEVEGGVRLLRSAKLPAAGLLTRDRLENARAGSAAAF
jgi:hypothetical protein